MSTKVLRYCLPLYHLRSLWSKAGSGNMPYFELFFFNFAVLSAYCQIEKHLKNTSLFFFITVIKLSIVKNKYGGLFNVK